MRVYGLSYRDTMEMPIQAFWFASGAINRLLAGERKDHLHLSMVAAHNPEEGMSLYETLDKASPEPFKLSGRAIRDISSVADQDAFNELRALQG